MVKHLLYDFMLLIPCHRKPERCLKIHGSPMPICARCFGIFLGYLSIPALFVFTQNVWLGVLLQFPMLTDGYTQLRGNRTSTNLLRLATGLLSGLGLSIILVNIVNFLILY